MMSSLSWVISYRIVVGRGAETRVVDSHGDAYKGFLGRSDECEC